MRAAILRSVALARPLARSLRFPVQYAPLTRLSTQVAATSSENSAEPQESTGEIKVSRWTPRSRRSGVIGRKMGMMQLWDDWGEVKLVTVLEVDSIVTKVGDGLTSLGFAQLQMAGFEKSSFNTKGPQMGEFKKLGIPPKAKLWGFQVTSDALLPVGLKMDVRHFFPGQYVDVQGKTKGKGFQGVMKRHGFGGQAKTHGVSKTHRHLGSTGGCQNPGRVFKGKKMPGNMGNKTQTAQCLQVYRIDVERNLLFVSGSVPGATGDFVKISDAKRRPFDPENPPPFPTFIPTGDTDTPAILEIPPAAKDPFDD